MDFNYYFQREQVERVRAERAACTASRAAHLGLADGYRTAIEAQRRRRLAHAGLFPELRRPAL